MRRILLLLSLFIIGSINANADVNISGGLRGGLNFQKFKAPGWQDNYVTTPMLGIYTNIGKGKWSLQVEANYTTMQYKTSSDWYSLYRDYARDITDSIKTGSFTLTQIQVPIMGCLRFNRRFSLQGGMMYTAPTSFVDKNDFLTSAKNIIKQNDISLIGGLWLQPIKRVSVSARYIQGLKNLNELPDSPDIWRNQSIQLGIGLKLF